VEVFDEYDKGNENQACASLEKSEHELSAPIRRYEDYINNRRNQMIDLEEDMLANGKRTMIAVSDSSIYAIQSRMARAIIRANSSSKPRRAGTDRMKVIGKGNLSNEPLQTYLRDEIGQLIQSTNEMSEITRGLLQEIGEVSETVSSQSNELSQSANEVRGGTE